MAGFEQQTATALCGPLETSTAQKAATPTISTTQVTKGHCACCKVAAICLTQGIEAFRVCGICGKLAIGTSRNDNFWGAARYRWHLVRPETARHNCLRTMTQKLESQQSKLEKVWCETCRKK